MKTQNQKRQHVFFHMKQMKDTGWLYHTLINSDIPKTINTNGIFLNISCLSDDHLDCLYNALADVKSKPIQQLSSEHSTHMPTVTKDHKNTPIKYENVKLSKLQKTIFASLMQ